MAQPKKSPLKRKTPAKRPRTKAGAKTLVKIAVYITRDKWEYARKKCKQWVACTPLDYISGVLNAGLLSDMDDDGLRSPAKRKRAAPARGPLDDDIPL